MDILAQTEADDILSNGFIDDLSYETYPTPSSLPDMDSSSHQYHAHDAPMGQGIDPAFDESIYSSPSVTGTIMPADEVFQLLDKSNSVKTERQIYTKDGQLAKRRGPKPDSKPALTKRQQMNRQAQRTHRQRKENHVRELEQALMSLRHHYVDARREKEATSEENRRLKELLRQHGISVDALQLQAARAGSESDSLSTGYPSASEQSGVSPRQNSTPQSQQYIRNHAQLSRPLPNNNLDYDQVGVDFILKFEMTCKGHMPYLLTRAFNPTKQFHHHPMEDPDDHDHAHMSGHALMATATPLAHILSNTPGADPAETLPGIGNADLAKLLDLSSQLPINHDGEMTPVMAWSFLLHHARFHELSAQEIDMVMAELAPKTRCYGFGAVVEEFEVEDALSRVLEQKDHAAAMYPLGEMNMAMQQISV